jgi:hypothetical protein
MVSLVRCACCDVVHGQDESAEGETKTLCGQTLEGSPPPWTGDQQRDVKCANCWGMLNM